MQLEIVPFIKLNTMMTPLNGNLPFGKQQDISAAQRYEQELIWGLVTIGGIHDFVNETKCERLVLQRNMYVSNILHVSIVIVFAADILVSIWCDFRKGSQFAVFILCACLRWDLAIFLQVSIWSTRSSSLFVYQSLLGLTYVILTILIVWSQWRWCCCWYRRCSCHM